MPVSCAFQSWRVALEVRLGIRSQRPPGLDPGTDNLDSGNTNAVVCSLRRSGSKIVEALGTFDEESAGSFDRGALDGMAYTNVATNGSLIVYCGKRLGDNPLLHVRIMAARIGP